MAKNNQERVLNFMSDNVGLHITPARVSDELGDLDRHQVIQAQWSLHKKGLIRKVSPGVYVYDGVVHVKTEDNGHVYETIGQLQDGTAVVRSDDGQLYVLESLEAHFGKE